MLDDVMIATLIKVQYEKNYFVPVMCSEVTPELMVNIEAMTIAEYKQMREAHEKELFQFEYIEVEWD